MYWAGSDDLRDANLKRETCHVYYYLWLSLNFTTQEPSYAVEMPCITVYGNVGGCTGRIYSYTYS